MGSAQENAAAAAATGFYRSLDDPTQACRSLAPGTLEELQSSSGPCEKSLPDQHLPAAARVRSVEVYGKDAMVRLDRDVMFLALFPGGWRVTAAGCQAQGDRPYDCTVQGG
jgi:hypothetical protein